jgi:hypothetical protein
MTRRERSAAVRAAVTDRDLLERIERVKAGPGGKGGPGSPRDLTRREILLRLLDSGCAVPSGKGRASDV